MTSWHGLCIHEALSWLLNLVWLLYKGNWECSSTSYIIIILYRAYLSFFSDNPSIVWFLILLLLPPPPPFFPPSPPPILLLQIYIVSILYVWIYIYLTFSFQFSCIGVKGSRSKYAEQIRSISTIHHFPWSLIDSLAAHLKVHQTLEHFYIYIQKAFKGNQ